MPVECKAKNGRPIKLYTFYNRDFTRLKERFLGTIKDDYEVICRQEDLDIGHGAWCGGEAVWLFKTQFVIDAIKGNPEDVILVSDIDIQFFKPTQEIVLKAIAMQDIVFQRNAPVDVGKINIGFMAIRCNDRCLAMFEWVLAKIIETKQHDQRLVAAYLRDFPGRIHPGLFPHSIFNYNPRRADHGLARGIALHHAIWARTEEDKLKQMEEIRLRVKGSMFSFYVWKIKKMPSSGARALMDIIKSAIRKVLPGIAKPGHA